MYDEQMSERTAKKESNGDRQIGFLGGPEAGGRAAKWAGLFKGGRTQFFYHFLWLCRFCTRDDDAIRRKCEANK